MAPPRRISRKQLEILIDHLEVNTDMCHGLPAGAPSLHSTSKQKWAALGKQLNAVPDGSLKTPESWKKYWFEWRHKCRKKAADARRYQTQPDGSSSRFIPLDDLEVRVLALSGKGSLGSSKKRSKQQDNSSSDDSDSEPFANIKTKSTLETKVKIKRMSRSSTVDEDGSPSSPPPKWVMDIEERSIAAQERIAAALETLAAGSERRCDLSERAVDALTVLAGSMQDIGAAVQQTLTHIQRLHPTSDQMHSNGPDIKDVFL
ncbi:uncharacterized protein LOC135088255 [Ostrinia nubilalis]|uniref:uncharacterized protein LOC135088255 n=1 Tax=Ostrinia nubilalis TaxID=29057 RepID=UPI00308254F7